MFAHRRGHMLMSREPDGFEAVTPAWSTRLHPLSRFERGDSFLQPPSRLPSIGVIPENGCYCKGLALTWREEQRDGEGDRDRVSISAQRRHLQQAFCVLGVTRIIARRYPLQCRSRSRSGMMRSSDCPTASFDDHPNSSAAASFQ